MRGLPKIIKVWCRACFTTNTCCVQFFLMAQKWRTGLHESHDHWRLRLCCVRPCSASAWQKGWTCNYSFIWIIHGRRHVLNFRCNILVETATNSIKTGNTTKYAKTKHDHLLIKFIAPSWPSIRDIMSAWAIALVWVLLRHHLVRLSCRGFTLLRFVSASINCLPHVKT